MNYKIIFLVFFGMILNGCNQQIDNRSLNYSFKEKYKNSGFTLIYDEQLNKEKRISKKIDNRSLLIYHKILKRNSLVKITNPSNSKSIIAKVKSNKVIFPDFYNSVITSRIAEELELDAKTPYIELILITKDSTFVAKKAKTFDEEKNVADKVPVDGIVIDNLNVSQKSKKKIEELTLSYSIKIADFYHKDSAKMMVKRIESETNLKNSSIRKISNTKYRVLIGPFNDIKILEKSYNVIKSLNFENLEILKNV
tara:strand:+ start:1034 stop:1792 length:759 start_codon:yes stop_codon:yes gene_type:complete